MFGIKVQSILTGVTTLTRFLPESCLKDKTLRKFIKYIWYKLNSFIGKCVLQVNYHLNGKYTYREQKKTLEMKKESVHYIAQTKQQWYLSLSVLKEASLHGDMTFKGVHGVRPLLTSHGQISLLWSLGTSWKPRKLYRQIKRLLLQPRNLQKYPVIHIDEK